MCWYFCNKSMFSDARHFILCDISLIIKKIWTKCTKTHNYNFLFIFCLHNLDINMSDGQKVCTWSVCFVTSMLANKLFCFTHCYINRIFPICIYETVEHINSHKFLLPVSGKVCEKLHMITMHPIACCVADFGDCC